MIFESYFLTLGVVNCWNCHCAQRLALLCSVIQCALIEICNALLGTLNLDGIIWFYCNQTTKEGMKASYIYYFIVILLTV